MYRTIGTTLLAAGMLGLSLVGCGDDGNGGSTSGRVIPPHCTMEQAPATAFAGGEVSARPLEAGAAEGILNMPIGSALGAYTSRAYGFGADGFYDERDHELAGSFSASVGIETAPRVKALVLRNGEDHVVFVRLDLGASYRGLTRDIEKALGEAYSGKVILATSHTHSGFGHFTSSEAFYLGFSIFRREVYDALLADIVATVEKALDRMVPARLGIAYDDHFDLDDRVNRDRRSANDELAGGKLDDHHLFVIRVDSTEGAPIAVVPVVGLHGTVGSPDNMWASVDAPGYIERVLEESFDDEVLVMHLQGAAGDVAPADSHGVPCSTDYCANYARMESVGQHAKAAILALHEAAGEAMRDTIEIEMLTRDVPLGPELENLVIRDGALRYATFDGVTKPDLEIYDEDGNIISPIDEFNAPVGAALCSEGVPLPNLLMPGGIALADTPYGRCNRVDRLASFIEPLFGFELGDLPVCDSIHTTVSALRLGEHVIATLPGEPTTLLVEALREASPAGADKTIVVGYAQDHAGYLLRPEDWLLGGYEPSITFWGPLEGEVIMERALDLIPLALSPEREDAAAGGVPYTLPKQGPDDLPPIDPSPLSGTVPETIPEGLLVPWDATLTQAQPADVLMRFETTHFVFIGDDPRKATPRVRLERETDGEWVPVRRRSGREVRDSELLLTWTPIPLVRDAGDRHHYYVVTWQAVPALGEVDSLDGRGGLPVGRYRIAVDLAEGRTVVSDEITVIESDLTLAGEAAEGGYRLSAFYDVPSDGFRLLRLDGPSTGLVPVRAALEVRFEDGGGMPLGPDLEFVDHDGTIVVEPPDGAVRILVRDAYGNLGQIAL